jgi:hypothetical protein
MGRHALRKPSASSRLFGAVETVVSAPFRWSPVERLLRLAIRKSLAGFFMVAGFTAVSIVDPYSGTMASAATMGLYQNTDTSPEQVYGWQSTQTISYSRGGFNIVTGRDAAALFVEVADIPTPGTNKAVAYAMTSDMGWGIDQYSCLVKLWDRESSWKLTATNKQSGAYGIPQALPGVKMSSEGEDWMTNPETQIRWGVKYIKARYGSACGALAHSNKFNWY